MAIEMNTGNTQKLSQAMYESLSKMSGSDSAELKEIVGKTMEVLAGSNLKVSNADTPGTGGAAEKKTTGSTNIPALDNPGDSEQVAANLEKLISYLQLDNQERQTEMAKERIEMQKDNLDAEHEDRMHQIDDSIKKMKDAESASKWSRAFSWIGAIVSVIAAIAVTVISGGAAAGFAIAGAALAVSSLVLNETGAMDTLTDKLAEQLKESFGMSKSGSKLAAALICNLTIAVASLGCGIGGMVSGAAAAAAAVANAANTGAKIAGMAAETAKTIQSAVTIANTTVSAGALATGGISTFYTKRSEETKADTTEIEKFIKQLEQRLAECQEELQQILEQIEAGVGTIAQMISSSTDTSDEIARNLGAMA